MSNDQHEPDEQFLTDAVRRQAEADNREAPDDRPMGPVGHTPSAADAAERADQAGLTEASQPGQGPTADDATPQTLIPDDGARSAAEASISTDAADTQLTEVGEAGAGGGYGPDEAELGRSRPLDGHPWDGDPEAPLEPETAADAPLTAPRGSEPDNSQQLK